VLPFLSLPPFYFIELFTVVTFLVSLIIGTNGLNGNEIGMDPKNRTNKIMHKNNNCLPIIKMKSDFETSTIH
jgi:hypothetical protein